MEAALDDYENGMFSSQRALIRAYVFASELEQAEELLEAGYPGPAAVVAGIVLETALRQMCDDRNIELGKLDKMNADLRKAGAYDAMVQKQITWLADMRNKAAHGQGSELTRDDVSNMIQQITALVPRLMDAE